MVIHPTKNLPNEPTKKQLLREMFLSGKTVKELADYFGRPENSIRVRLFYMGLSKESPISVLRKKS